MRKTVKIAVAAVLGMLVLTVALLLAHPLWLAPAVKAVANSQVPAVTGTAFRIDGIALNAYRGKVSLSGIVLENPEGYSERIALKVGRLDVTADMESVTSNVVVLKEVAISDVFVSYVSKDGVNNFDRIAKNASGKKEPSADSGAKTAPAAEDGAAAEGKEEPVRVVIDLLTVKDASVKMGMFTLPVPPITLTKVGEKSGGVTLAELGNQLLGAVLSAVGSAKDGVGALGLFLGDGVKDLKGQLESGDMKGVENSLRKGADALKEAEKALKSLFR